MNKESGSDVSSAGCSNSSSFTVPAARKRKIQKRLFCLVWLEDPEFKPWLQQVPQNPYKGKCSICNLTITAIKSNLQRHGNSQEHMKNMTYANSSVERSTDESTSTDEATDMDVGTESSSDNSITVSTQKKKWRQIFVADWLEDPAFKPWLQQVPQNPYEGKCTFCDKTIKAKKCNLLRHVSTHEHIRHMKSGRSAVERNTDEALSTDVAISTDEATDMDVGTESSSDNNFTIPAPQEAWRQTFLADWLEDPAFKPWLQQVPQNPCKGKCTFCDITIKAKKCNLQQHAESQKHVDNITYGQRVLPGEGTRSFTNEVKEAEIRVCTDAIEHNRPFNSFQHYVRLTQSVCKNPNVLKRMSLSGKKMKAICLNVINKSIVDKIMKKMQGKYFSVLIDETTDVSNMKLLCFLIRYVDGEKICTDLLDLIRINEATAEKLYDYFKQSLDKFNLPISNMVGVCVDNANVMVGAYNSITSRIVAANSEVCIIPCICHSLHLAARHSCECLPKDIEKFLQNLYSYFSQSPKRLYMLEGTQQFMKVAKLKVKQPSATRWLALAACINRVLIQWTVLFGVIAEASSDKEAAAEKILSSMNSQFTKAYLEFLNYYLTFFTTLNKLFQSSEVLVHRLLPECKKLLLCLALNFIQPEKLCVPDIHNIDICNEDNLLPITTIGTGPQCTATLSEITNRNNWEENGDMIQFFTNIKKCYVTGYQQIVHRVPFEDPFLNALDFLNPQTATNVVNHDVRQVQCVLNNFSSKVGPEVLNEWVSLPTAYLESPKEPMNLLKFWHETSIIENYKFANISQLAQLCLSLPHSNAGVERFFSIVTQIKTKGRNKLHPETLAAVTRIKLDMSNQNTHCYNYEITDEMIQIFNTSMYDKEEKPEQVLGCLLANEENDGTTDNGNN